jgi:hypothetical protein
MSPQSSPLLIPLTSRPWFIGSTPDEVRALILRFVARINPELRELSISETEMWVSDGDDILRIRWDSYLFVEVGTASGLISYCNVSGNAKHCGSYTASGDYFCEDNAEWVHVLLRQIGCLVETIWAFAERSSFFSGSELWGRPNSILNDLQCYTFEQWRHFRFELREEGALATAVSGDVLYDLHYRLFPSNLAVSTRQATVGQEKRAVRELIEELRGQDPATIKKNDVRNHAAFHFALSKRAFDGRVWPEIVKVLPALTAKGRRKPKSNPLAT